MQQNAAGVLRASSRVGIGHARKKRGKDLQENVCAFARPGISSNDEVHLGNDTAAAVPRVSSSQPLDSMERTFGKHGGWVWKCV